MIALGRIDHVRLRTADVAEASARWAAQFGLADRGGGRLACDDEPYCLELAPEDPHRFDVGRTPNRHMAFGPGGIHHCMGAHLAKMEIRITFEELLARSADIELVGPPDRLRSNFFNGIKRLPVRVTQ